MATVIDAELVVIAVAHHKRSPTYWRQRLKGIER